MGEKKKQSWSQGVKFSTRLKNNFPSFLSATRDPKSNFFFYPFDFSQLSLLVLLVIQYDLCSRNNFLYHLPAIQLANEVSENDAALEIIIPLSDM